MLNVYRPSRLILGISLLLLASSVGCNGTANRKDAVNASTLSGNLKFDLAASRQSFSTTVWVYTKSHCASCHSTSKSPFTASSDLAIAHDAALSKVNFSDVTLSGILRKSKDSHCGGECSTDGSVLLAALQKWKDSLVFIGGDIPGGEVVRKGNIFTKLRDVPLPNLACKLPDDLACSPEGTRVDVVDGVTVTSNCNNTCWSKLRYPVTQMNPNKAILEDGLQRAWFEMDFAYTSFKTELGSASYVLKNPRIVSPDQATYIFDIKFFLNGEYRPDYGMAYRQVDLAVNKATFGTNGLSTSGDVCVDPKPSVSFDPEKLKAGCIPQVPPLFTTAASASGIVQINEGDPIKQTRLKASRMAYQGSVYQYLRTVGCYTCHETMQTPLHSSASITIAHDSGRKYAYLGQPEDEIQGKQLADSIFIARATNGHCNKDICTENPGESTKKNAMTAAIEKWKADFVTNLAALNAAGVPASEIEYDTLGFSFEYLQKGNPGVCNDVGMFVSNIFNVIGVPPMICSVSKKPPASGGDTCATAEGTAVVKAGGAIGAVACLNCHKPGGGISEAGQRFNMDPYSEANGYSTSISAADRFTANDPTMKTICQKFLQRSNFRVPDNSPIIVQPRSGLNGMPPQANFAAFSDNWIHWVEREKSLAK